MARENAELIDYLRVIWKWKLLILLITVVCAITSGVVSFVLPKIYQSSAILEVGRIVRYRGTEDRQIETIEDIESVNEILKSDEMLNKIKEKLNLNTPLEGIRARLDVEPILGKYIGSRLQARLIKITFGGRDPQLTVDVLNTLSGLLIEQHVKEYQAAIESLAQEIANSQEKIKIIDVAIEAINRQIEAINRQIETINRQIAIMDNEIKLQNEYRKVVVQQIKVAEKAIVETRQDLSQLNLKNVSPLEVLFLRSTLRDQEGRIASFYRELKDVELSIEENRRSIEEQKALIEENRRSIEKQKALIAENQKDAQDLRDKIVYLEHMRAVSENTKVRNKAVKPDTPIRPRKKINAIIGGVVGFVAAIILAFFFEYLQTVRMRKREEAR